jgi:hypothetical protein
MLDPHAARDRHVGEDEAALQVLGVDALRHMIGERAQQDAVEIRIRHGHTSLP